ncbi:hypothetical protein ERICI_02448 [Paenibacillus larvae subsp. larvae]|nr:hypothetical protein BXP28_04935 [Paenibacillus larvae subsp. larvae]AVF22288.1 hypothetical protein ERICI_02448 [Paenibacillus larvae subsp. larvae]AVG12252.1 hypothetical protein ERICII_01865 [Paenibacillus larvae subsp. larvae DSM 25430]ETK26866.1 hypothetical protein ERIC1_1c03010 [Paenibacillus larvae subsp. larvae DSM 25719]QHZ51767.1 hypothetical protein ERICV_02645 [Paenibacillus larvae subsp. larvae]
MKKRREIIPSLKLKTYIISCLCLRRMDDQEPLEAKINRLLDRSAIDFATWKAAIVPMKKDIGEVAALLGKKRAGIVLVEENGVLKGTIIPNELIRNVFRKQILLPG